MPKFEIRDQDLINNPTARVAVCLCLDVSPSMSGREDMGAAPGTIAMGVPIDELNEGVSLFYESLKDDENARYAAEVAVVTFSSIITKLRDFETVVNAEPPKIELELRVGGTSIGNAMTTCLQLLQERKEKYKQAGVEYYQPWLVLMSDGRPSDNTHEGAAVAVADLVNRGKLTIFAIGVGAGWDRASLAALSPKRDPLKLKGLHFKEFL